MVVPTRVALKRAVSPVAVLFLLGTAASSTLAQEQGRGSVRHSGADYSVHVDNRNPLPNGLDRTGTQSTAGAADNRNDIDRTRQDNRNEIDRTKQDDRNNLPDGLDPIGRQSVPGAADNRNQITEQRTDNRTDHRGDEMYELDTSRGAAPRNHHYVRPGTRVGALPRSYVPLNVGGSTF